MSERLAVKAFLEIEQGYGDDDSGDEERGDEFAVAAVTVGHVEAGDGRDEEADRDQKEEEL